MKSEELNFDRHFQVWKYTVGHGDLLLRSTKTPEEPTRVDVLFKNVSLINLPTSFDGLLIREMSDIERIKFAIQISAEQLKSRRIFVVRGLKYEGHVVAGVVVCHEDKGEYNDPSFFSPH